MPLAVFVPAQLNDLAVDVSVGTPAQGAVLYRGASRWNSLPAGTSGQVLTSGGAAANPAWATPSTGATNLDALSDVNLPTASQGDILYRNATEWVRLVAGTAGQALLTGGAGANPAWGAPAADLSPAVILGPTTSARNVIQPTGNFIAAILRGDASQTLDMTQWQLSDATVVGSISSIGAALHRPKDAVTAAVTVVQTLGHQTSGTPANGYGTELRFQAQSTTTIGRDAVGIQALWATAADATRKARGVLNVYDTAVREAMRFESDGSFGLVGFGGPVLANTHVGICCAAATNKGLVVQGAASQSANLQEWQNSSATILASLTKDGTLFINGPNGVNLLDINTPSLQWTLQRSSGIGGALVTVNAPMRIQTTSGSLDLFSSGGSLNLRYDAAQGFTLKDSSGTDKLLIQSSSFSWPYSGQSSVDDVTQDVLRVKPITTPGTFWRPFALYLLSTDTEPSTYLDKLGDWNYSRLTSIQVRQASSMVTSWATATDASRKARTVFNVWDTAAREAFRIEANGSNPMIGFLGATASARDTGWSVSNVTTDRSYDANSTTIDELADVLGTLIAQLTTKGLIGA